MAAAIAVLLGFAALVAILSAVGLLLAPNPFARLHYLGPANILAPVAVALAVLAANGLSTAAFKAFLIAALLMVTGPILTHATARAALSRSKTRPRLPAEAGEPPEER